ncbi:MAG: DUF3168 domain-containing protein [Rubrivivax sp.]
MKAEIIVKTRLGAVSGVTALVSDRVYPGALPQDAVLPAIVFKRISSRRLKGAHSNPGIVYATLQVICVGAKDAPQDDVLALAEQVRLALDRYGNIVNGVLVGGVLLYDIQLGSEAAEYDEALDAHVHSADYTVNHKE